LIVAIAASALVSISLLRDKYTDEWKRNLGSMSLLVAEHTSNTLFSAYLVLDSIARDVRETEVSDDAQFRERLSKREFFHLIKSRIQGMPQLDVASIVAANGDNINFTRGYPVKKINLAERDYFKAQKDNPALGVFISKAVRNKGNGKWTFYISRRIDDPQGKFLGIVVVGLSVDVITGLYEQLVQSVGPGSAVTLLRKDFSTLARAPGVDELVGKVQEGAAFDIIQTHGLNADVVLGEVSAADGRRSEKLLSAVRGLERYPLVVALEVPESIFLAGWRKSSLVIGATALATIAVLVMGLRVLARSNRRREQVEQELRESETKFHTMLNWSADWEYWLRPDGSLHYMTPSANAFTGYEVADFENDVDLINRLIHPEDQADWRRKLGPAASRESIDGADAPDAQALFDVRILQRDGSPRWTSCTVRSVSGADGGWLGTRVTMRDISERKASESEIRTLAYYDTLTSLPNRRLLMDRLSVALKASARRGSVGALMMLDLDHFKKLNDTRGHEEGDRLLLEVALRLKDQLRDTDTVARTDGDEFALMLQDLGPDDVTAAQQAQQIASRLFVSLNRPYALSDSNRGFHCTFSAGVSFFQGACEPVDVLMKQADLALYQAKEQGRNTLRYFNPAMQATINARTSMEIALRAAVGERRFKLFYQPQLDAERNIVGAEALIRWHDPVLGFVPPQVFINLAEEIGLIVEIGQWVLETACDQLRSWSRDPNRRHLTISVNVSAKQFHQPDFVQQVNDCLARYEVPAERLVLELTESVLVEHLEGVTAQMEELHRVGVQFSLDDFGTGYSSLSYLKRLPIDEIKIDRSFVRDVLDDNNDSAIVSAILSMGQSLGLRVVAEGVETEGHHAFLVGLGCDIYQGYLYGKPVPIEQWDASPARAQPVMEAAVQSSPQATVAPA
jgi:diguanylate cyclase (GGDEF)-like protein/PAS domain S-box-containing protein